MQFIDLKSQYELLREDLAGSFNDILSDTRFIMGKEVTELETKLADYVGVSHCISCSSGTDALLIPLMAQGIGQGDAVFVPSFSFYATAEAVALTGATPVFVDVCMDSFNMDIAKLEKAIHRVNQQKQLRPAAIIPVDLFGLPAEHLKIQAVARDHKLFVLEDAAQSFGSRIGGQKSCSFGHAAATSFFPAKPLGCYGDGGAVFTSDDELADRLRSIRVHGQGTDKYENIRIGINGRLDTLQAAVLLQKLTIFDEELQKRNRIASSYTQAFAGKLQTPVVPDGYFSSWAQYSLLAKDEQQRQAIMDHLAQHDIPSMIYYKIPLHRQKAFSCLPDRTDELQVSDYLSQMIFSIPMHPYLSDEDISRVTGTLMEVLY